MAINSFQVYGVVMKEPILMKIKDGKLMARTVIAIPP